MSLSKNILVIMTGSIACYKAAHVLSRLTQSGHQVQVVATKSALEFIGAATIEGLTGRPVCSDLHQPGEMMGHIHWARWADLILVAPATANYINKIASGFADDLASTLFLAHDFTKPFVITPAMNTAMYLHPITQSSMEKLKHLGVEILETASGVLACGENGFGRLLEPDLILKEVSEKISGLPSQTPPKTTARTSESSVTSNEKTAKKLAFKILITAGGTTEKIDEVRSITNTSTGKTGFELAQNLYHMGLPVHLLISKNSLYQKNDFPWTKSTFDTFDSLNSELHQVLSAENFTHVIHLAAVSDYSVEKVTAHGKTIESHKIASNQNDICIHLKPNPKILSQLKSYSQNKNCKIIGFKLTVNANTDQQLQVVKKVFNESACDSVVQNDLSEISESQHSFKVFKKDLSFQSADNILQLIPLILGES